MVTSKTIADLIRTIKDVDDEWSQSCTEQRECEDKQNDILHDLELVEHTHNERGRIAKDLAEIRRKRRTAKDHYELLQPLVSWAAQYQNAIHALERVLGDMRKIEEKQKNRIYRKRTDGEIVQSDSRRKA